VVKIGQEYRALYMAEVRLIVAGHIIITKANEMASGY